MTRLETVKRIIRQHDIEESNIEKKYADNPVELTELNNKIENARNIVDKATKKLDEILAKANINDINDIDDIKAANISLTVQKYKEIINTAEKNQKAAETAKEALLKEREEKKEENTLNEGQELFENDAKTMKLLREQLAKLLQNKKNIKAARKVIYDKLVKVYEIKEIPQPDGKIKRQKVLKKDPKSLKTIESIKQATEYVNSFEKDIEEALKLCKGKLKEFGFEIETDDKDKIENVQNVENTERISKNNVDLQQENKIEQKENQENNKEQILEETKILEKNEKKDINIRPMFAQNVEQTQNIDNNSNNNSSGKVIVPNEMANVKDESQTVQRSVQPIIQPVYEENVSYDDYMKTLENKNAKVKITYNAKTDTYLVRNLKTKQVKIYSRKELQPLSKKELGTNMASKLEGLKNIDMNILKVLTDYNKDKRYMYYDVMRQQTLTKSKSQMKKLMKEAKIEIEYDLDGIYGKRSELLVKDRLEMLAIANGSKELGVAKVKKGLKVKFLEHMERKLMLSRKEKLLSAPSERAFGETENIENKGQENAIRKEQKIYIPQETRQSTMKTQKPEQSIQNQPELEEQNQNIRER